MASVSLNDVLSAAQLCGAFETLRSGLPKVLPAGFFAPADQETAANTASYFQYPGQRQVAKLNSYGGSSTAVQMKPIAEVPVVLFHTCENLVIPAHKLLGKISKDSSGSNLLIDDKGVQEVARQVKAAVMRVTNLKTALVTQLFVLGDNYFDAAGNLLPSSSGNKTDAASKITAANLGNLTTVLSGSTIWTNSAADIEDQLIQLQQLSMDNTGYDLRYAVYGRNIVKYITNNAKLTAYLSRNVQAQQAYIGEAALPPLGGLTWLPGFKSSFRDQNDATQRIVGDDQVLFLPEPNPDWFGWIDGHAPIVNSIDAVGDGMAAMSNWSSAKGDYMYAYVAPDPVAIKLIFGTTTIPTVRVPSAVYAVNTTL